MVLTEKLQSLIFESNSARRELTKPLKDNYILNQKVTPSKRIFIDNEASRKLVFDVWKGNKNDCTGRLMISSIPNEYGGNNYFGVWEEVKGKDFLYADVKNINGKKWSFTELWLSPEGVKKLQNNIVPTNSMFRRGDKSFKDNSRDSRRRNALKKVNVLGKENVANIAKEFKKADWNKTKEMVDKYGHEIDFRHTYHEKSDKKWDRQLEVSENLRKIFSPLEKYYSSDVADEAWKIRNPLFSEIEELSEQGKTKEAAEKIELAKKKINDFLAKQK